MASKIITALVVFGIVAGIFCFAFWNRTKESLSRLCILAHRTLSIVLNLSFIAAAVLGLWGINHYLVILVPCVMLILYPLWWGLNTELTEEEQASLVVTRGFLFRPSEKFRALFLRLFTFVPYYLIAAWKQKIPPRPEDTQGDS